MQWTLCITTPAGEQKSFHLEYRDLQDHEIQAPLRNALAQAMAWIDNHISWNRDEQPFPRIKVPFHGNADWNIRFHPASRTCAICDQL